MNKQIHIYIYTYTYLFVIIITYYVCMYIYTNITITYTYIYIYIHTYSTLSCMPTCGHVDLGGAVLETRPRVLDGEGAVTSVIAIIVVSWLLS